MKIKNFVILQNTIHTDLEHKTHRIFVHLFGLLNTLTPLLMFRIMCDGIQSAVIHSSTAQWEVGGSEVWGGPVPPPPYQPHHPLWEQHAQQAQYQPDLFGFGAEFWARQAAPSAGHHSRYIYSQPPHPISPLQYPCPHALLEKYWPISLYLTDDPTAKPYVT